MTATFKRMKPLSLLLLLPAAMASRIDFAGFSAGDWVSDVGLGTTVKITAKPGVGCFGGPLGNEPMIFDSENPSSVDEDLGTPNKDFGGPGKGNGGKRGAPGENSVGLGNLLIFSTDCNQEIPNDELEGGTFTFTFDKPKNIKSVGTLDFSKGVIIKVSHSNGAPDSTFNYAGLGKNGFLESFLYVENVSKMQVIVKDSGGIAFVDFYDPIDPVGAYGDPHFKMWNGDIYSFAGACDLVLLEHPSFAKGDGLNIHLRTSTRKDFSYIQSAVVQIGGDTLEVTAGDEAGSTLTWSNGSANSGVPSSIHGYPISYRSEVLSTGVLEVFSIHLGAENAIVIKSFPDLVDVRLRSSDSRQSTFGSSKGLLGSLAGKMVGRDGTIFEDSTAFAQNWRVQSSDDSLFHDGMQGPSTCSFPTSEGRERNLRKATASVTAKSAKSACAGFADQASCVSDVLAVGDLGFARHFQ